MNKELEHIVDMICDYTVKNFKLLNKEQRQKFDEVIKLFWEINDLIEEGEEKMTKADKMFEKLGYKKADDYDKKDISSVLCYYEGNAGDYIRFWQDKSFDSVAINMEELKAIIEKCKELGWLNEN